MAERRRLRKEYRSIAAPHRNFLIAIRIATATTLLVLAPTSAQAQNAFAHWTFDTASITTGAGGRIETAADTTGLHNATAVYGGTGVTITSVPGQFGQGALFGNNAGADATNHGFFEFPQMGEIDGPDGGDFTIAAWVNSTNTTRSNTVFATWIAGGAANNFTYWFSLANVDTNAASRPRGQFRSSNNPNDDIVAFTLALADPTTDNVADNSWHHVAWTWKKDIKTMFIYIDGVQSNAIVSTDVNVDILPSGSPVGHIGSKRDTNHYFQGSMDELWVLDTALDVNQVNTLMTQNGFGPPPVLGDTDGDGIGGEFPDDFEPIRMNFRKAALQRNEGDLVNDNIIDFKDFREWKTAFLSGGGSLADIDLNFLSAVPEPSAALLLFVGSIGLLLQRSVQRRR